MNINYFQLGLGILFAILISLTAWKARSLSISGAVAATLLGTVVFGLGGLVWAILLMVFFITSSGLSHVFKKKKLALDEKFSKGSQRDAGQVLANGGIAGFFVILHLFYPHQIFPWLGFAGALAAANADTWATELGVLSSAGAVLITSGKPVEKGTSGGVSFFGTLAAFCGAGLLALAAAFLSTMAVALPFPWEKVFFIIMGISLAGLLGSLVDSLLGATIQAIYRCPVCDKETEKHPLHSCGTPTTLVRGLGWLDNDWVNIGCTLVGGLLGLLIFIWF